MNILNEPLPGVFLLQPTIFSDERGHFIKSYHQEIFMELGISFEAREEFFSISRKGVIRGMHFQLPPEDHGKLVYCIAGSVLDVLLDLRSSQGNYGAVGSALLSAENRLALYIPPGIAHGFASLEENSTMIYKTSSVHSPAHDAGIHWNSFGFDWGISQPIVSKRDREHPSFADFVTSF
jgi:dTDP-4-dehydrorhamnose 3,5-epimerase